MSSAQRGVAFALSVELTVFGCVLATYGYGISFGVAALASMALLVALYGGK